MKKTDKKIIEKIIRVDHAGERGAIKIYEGQLLALDTIKKNENLRKQIRKMKEQEHEHYNFFDMEIQKRNISPTKLLPLWDLISVGLGFSSILLGKKAAMLCTASVEEVIESHYENQLKKIGNDEKDLKNKIEKFKDDEVNHKNTAYDSGASKSGIYSVLDTLIRTGSKIAINISEKI